MGKKTGVVCWLDVMTAGEVAGGYCSLVGAGGGCSRVVVSTAQQRLELTGLDQLITWSVLEAGCVSATRRLKQSIRHYFLLWLSK